MNKRRLLAAFCALAFTIVFAHSLIPHQHHCHEAHEEHIHHFANCEQLSTFVLSQYDNSSQNLFPCPLHLHICAHCHERIEEQRVFDYSDSFSFAPLPILSYKALRAPPVV